MFNEIILASKSKVRKKILENNNITFKICASNVDEDLVKKSLLKEGATPKEISKNLAELKANKISQKFIDAVVIGADSVISLDETIISKPTSRKEAMEILKKLNGKKHQLISSVCISRGGSMIWNYTEIANLTMKDMKQVDLDIYLEKIKDSDLYAYNVYQIEGEGRNLFIKIEGNENTIMGLPVDEMQKYLKELK